MKTLHVVSIILLACAMWHGTGMAQVRLGVITDGISDYWTAVRDAMQTMAAEKQFVLDFRMPTEPAADQQRTLAEQALAAGAAALAICPVDPAAQENFINELAAKIPVVTVGKDVPDSQRKAFVGRNEMEVGRQLAVLIQECVPDGLKVMAFCGSKTEPEIEQRIAGIKEGLAETETILDSVQEDLGDRMLAWANVDDMLNKRPEIAATIGLQGYLGPVLLRAIEEHKRAKMVRILCFDAVPPMRDALQQGTVQGLVVDDVEDGAQKLANTLLALARNDAETGIPENKHVETALTLLRSQQKRDVQEMMNEIKVQVPWMSEVAPSTP